MAILGLRLGRAGVFAGYKDRLDSWVMDQSKGTATEPPPWLDKNGKPIDWYAGKQYDDDTADAKKALAELDKHYPGAQGCEVAGFFFRQGEKDCGKAEAYMDVGEAMGKAMVELLGSK